MITTLLPLEGLLIVLVVTFFIILLKQNNEIKSLQHDNKVYHDVLSTLDIGFCSVDFASRSEMISFQGLYSFNGLYDLLEEPEELKGHCGNAPHTAQSFSLILKIKGKHRYIKCLGKSLLEENNIRGLILILEDVSKSVQLSTKNKAHTTHILEDKQYYMNILNSAPYLVWEYDSSGEIKYANELYLKYFGDRLLTTHDQTHKSLSIDGEPRTFSIHKVKNKNSIINFSHDVTGLSDAEKKVEGSVKAKKDIIAHIKTPIAFYDQNICIKLYNDAFVNLWDLERSWLNKSPSYSELCEKLYAEGKVLKNDVDTKLLMEIIKPYSAIIGIPNADIHVTIIPEIDHSLWFIYEIIK